MRCEPACRASVAGLAARAHLDARLHLSDRVGRADELVVVFVDEHLHIAVEALDL